MLSRLNQLHVDSELDKIFFTRAATLIPYSCSTFFIAEIWPVADLSHSQSTDFLHYLSVIGNYQKEQNKCLLPNYISRGYITFFTIRRKFLTGENIDEFDEFPAIRQYFSYQNFPFS